MCGFQDTQSCHTVPKLAVESCIYWNHEIHAPHVWCRETVRSELWSGRHGALEDIQLMDVAQEMLFFHKTLQSKIRFVSACHFTQWLWMVPFFSAILNRVPMRCGFSAMNESDIVHEVLSWC